MEYGAYEYRNQVSNNDTGSNGWACLGCCIPIVGLILWLVWKDTQPQNAKKAGIGALIGVGCILLYYIFLFVMGIVLGFASL